jgi:glucose-1-phosphate thymidylyltransferase
LTKEYPKPLLRVKNKPILEYIIEKLEAADKANEIFVVTNSKFIAKFRQWKKTFKSKARVTLVDDRTKSNVDRLGAIGDVNFVINKKRVKEDVLVIGGDNLFSGSLSKFLKFARNNKPAATIGLYKLKNLKDASRYGVAKLDKDNRVVYFEEKPKKPKSRLVAMCLYYIPFECLGLIKEYIRVQKKADATGNYIDWLKDKIKTFGFVFKGSWYDIGDFKYLNEAKNNFAK